MELTPFCSPSTAPGLGRSGGFVARESWLGWPFGDSGNHTPDAGPSSIVQTGTGKASDLPKVIQGS